MTGNPTAQQDRGSSSVGTSRRSRTKVLAACKRCRRWKKRCDNTRPCCGLCQRANAPCQYDTEDPNETRSQALRNRFDNLQALHQDVRLSLDWLRSQPSATALSCLERIKGAADPLHELCAVVLMERSQRLPVNMGQRDVLIATLPSLNNMLEAEFGLRHPVSFPQLPDKPSALLRSNSANISVQPQAPRATDSAGRRRAAHVLRSDVSSIHARDRQSLCDVRLHSLKIGFWTTVAISNELAANLLSSYMYVEQPVYGFFDSDLFLDDLVSQEVQHCTPLLLNAVLFWACCTFGPIYPAASALAGKFLDSAQLLLEPERGSASLLTVAALTILAVGSICFGQDKLAKSYMITAIQMGEKLHLMGQQRYKIEDFGHLSQDSMSMLSYVAWGSFNFSTVYALHFHDVHSGTFTKYPPLLPRPGSELPLKQPLSPSPLPRLRPAYLGTSFPWFCKLWCIAHEIASVYYSPNGPIHQHVPLAFAESRFHSLLAWADSLPPDLVRSANMTHNVAEMHICYHAIIMDIFRPFLGQRERLSTISTDPRRPEAIFLLSLSHLKDLTHHYHTYFAGLAESYTISWAHGPLYVAPAILRYDEVERRKIEFLFYMKTCSSLIEAHSVLEGFIKALAGMAISAGVLTIAEAHEHLHGLIEKRADDVIYEAPEIGFVVDQDLAVENRTAAVGNVLAQQFDEMLLFQDVQLD